MKAPSTQHIPEFWTPRGKADVGHKPQGLGEQVRHRERLLSVLGMVGTSLKSKCADASQGPILQAGLSEDGRLRSAL